MNAPIAMVSIPWQFTGWVHPAVSCRGSRWLAHVSWSAPTWVHPRPAESQTLRSTQQLGMGTCALSAGCEREVKGKFRSLTSFFRLMGLAAVPIDGGCSGVAAAQLIS